MINAISHPELRKKFNENLVEAEEVVQEVVSPQEFKHMVTMHNDTVQHMMSVGALLAVAVDQLPARVETPMLHSARRYELLASGALHDFGKFDEDILRTISMPRRLTEQERLLVGYHTAKGATRLTGMIGGIACAEQAPIVNHYLSLASFAAEYHHTNSIKVIYDELGDLMVDDEENFSNPVRLLMQQTVHKVLETIVAVQVADRIEAMTDVERRPYLVDRLPSEGLATVEGGQLKVDTDAITNHILSGFKPIDLGNGVQKELITLPSLGGLQLSSIIQTMLRVRNLA